jgi:hypothetical protein
MSQMNPGVGEPPLRAAGRSVLLEVARRCVVGVLVLALFECFTGVMVRGEEGGLWTSVHNFGSSLLIWSAVGAFWVSFAAFMEQARIRGRVLFPGRILVAIVSVLLALNTGFTGYLGPVRNPDIGEEDLIRFRAIHQFIEPALLLGFLFWWWVLLRGLARVPGKEAAKADQALGAATDGR